MGKGEPKRGKEIELERREGRVKEGDTKLRREKQRQKKKKNRGRGRLSLRYKDILSDRDR